MKFERIDLDWFQGVETSNRAFAEALAEEFDAEEEEIPVSDDLDTQLLYAGASDMQVTVSSWW